MSTAEKELVQKLIGDPAKLPPGTRWMIHYKLIGHNHPDPRYKPIGIWITGPGPGLDLEMRYLPGNEEEEDDANWIINRLVERGVKGLPEDFLEYHQQSMSGYRGMLEAI